MKPRPFTLLAAISVLLFLGAVGALAINPAGHFTFHHALSPPHPVESLSQFKTIVGGKPSRIFVDRAGLRVFRGNWIDDQGIRDAIVLVLPLWLIALVALPLPLVWFFHHRQNQLLLNRLSTGLCQKCGYDLRAQLVLSEQRESDGSEQRESISSERSKSNGPPRCPECGTPIPNPQSQIRTPQSLAPIPQSKI